MSNALHKAAQNGELETLRTLLAAGADVNAIGFQDNTPLMLAALHGQVEAVRMLLKAGARPNDASVTGHNALIMAGAFGYVEIISLLRSAGAEVGLLEAATIGDCEALYLLLAQRTDINTGNEEATAALIEAAHNGHLEAVRLLLNAGANINGTTKFGLTALMKALHEGHLEIALLLIDCGADVTLQSNRGETALHTAVMSFGLGRCLHHKDGEDIGRQFQRAKEELHTMIRLLVQRGCRVNAKNEAGMTALWWAERSHDKATCGLLRELGAYD